MANRWLLAGCDIGIVRTIAGTPTTDTTTSRRNTSYADHQLSHRSSDRWIADFINSSGATDAATTGETLWVMVNSYQTATATVGNQIELVDGTDQPWLAIRSTASATIGLYYNSGTGASPAWTQIGSSWTHTNATVSYYVIKLTLGSPHSAEMFFDGVSVASGTFTQASLTSIDAIHFRGAATVTNYSSEVAAAVGINLVGARVYYGKPSGSGNSSGWTGAATTVDDVGIDDTDFATSGTAAQRTTWAYADHPASALVSGDWFMFTRAKNDGAAPANIKPVRRTAGTDNVGSSFSGIGAGFAEFHTRYSGLSASDYDSSEFGVESAT